MVLLLMTPTAIGSYGFLTRPHLQHQVEAALALARDAAPLAQQNALTKSSVADLDRRMLDAIVKAATGRGPTKIARLPSQARGPSASKPANRLVDLKVQQANVEAQRASAEAGLALYLAKLFGSDDTEAMVRLITAVLLLVLALAVLLTLAASRDHWAVLG